MRMLSEVQQKHLKESFLCLCRRGAKHGIPSSLSLLCGGLDLSGLGLALFVFQLESKDGD